MFDKNTEASFVLNGVFEFIKAWQSGSKSRLTLHSKNGQAWINFNCCLGGPFDQHEKLSAKPKAKSKKKQERDNLRAQLYQQRLRDQNSSTKSGDGSLNLQLSSLSSQNESQMPMEGVSSSFIHTAASSSPKNADLTRNEKSNVSDSIPSTVIDDQNDDENPPTPVDAAFLEKSLMAMVHSIFEKPKQSDNKTSEDNENQKMPAEKENLALQSNFVKFKF